MHRSSSWRMLCSSVLLTWLALGVTGSHEESTLLKHLLANYDVLERPVKNVTDAVTVYLQVIMQQIIDLDEKGQVMTINAWLKYVGRIFCYVFIRSNRINRKTWNDPRLVWEPREYDNIYDTRTPYDRLWRPDVLLYNSVDSTFDSTYPTNFVIYADGTVNWIPPGIFLISCKIKIKWYPFDKQTCFFKFGSWTFDGTKIDLQPDPLPFDMSEYMLNGEFQLMKTEVIRSEKFYDCCPEPYPDLRFLLHIRRRTLYSFNNFVIPCILITVMTIIGFMLPPDSGEKISLQITVLLAVSVLLSIVSNMVPPTSEDVPLLGVFFIVCMIFCSFSLVVTTYVLVLHHSGPDMEGELGPLGRLLLLEWLPWLLFMERPGKPVTKRELKNPFSSDWLHDTDDHNSEQLQAMLKLEARVRKCCRLVSKNSEQFNVWTQATVMLMQRIFEELRNITKRMKDADSAGEAENDFKFAAAVVDRLGCWMFTTSLFLGTCYIFFSAPYLSAQDDLPS